MPACRRRSAAGTALLALSLIAAGCSKTPSRPEEPAVAVVDGDRIGRKDLQYELQVRSKQDPAFQATPAALTEQIEILIDRRLLIQEAVRRKLAEEDEFVLTIRNFWEQTLVRRLMEELSYELSQGIAVSDAEIAAFYAKLSVQATFEIARRTTRQEAEALVQSAPAAAGAPAGWDETAGPVTYDRLTSPFLERAFDELEPGGASVFEQNGIFYAVRLLSKEAVTPPELTRISSAIKRVITQRKQRAAFAEWIRQKRSRAKIRVLTEKEGL